MITSKYIINLSEEYFTSKSINGDAVVLYVNPTAEDFTELYKDGVREIRWIADAKNKKVYVFDARLAIHQEALRVFFNIDWFNIFLNKSNQYFYLFLGGAKLFNKTSCGSPESAEVDYLFTHPRYIPDHIDYLDKVFTYNWQWLDKYISGANTYLISCKQKYAQIRQPLKG